jgi:eukaryotic-like serine/threonine-protein kinase
MQHRQVGKYSIIQKIGTGAMGEVYKAHDAVLGRDVAIKVVLAKLSEDEEARKRFAKEARAAAQLNHPGITTVYDFGDENGQPYMAMELLDGHDLRELLARSALKELEDKLSLMEQVLDGLAFAHSKGVVHRDMKPGNVRVLPSGKVKLMDFGLARSMQDAAASGVVLGTPYYMAPEQAHGDAANARSDVFSLGAMFYELLAGRKPFTGSTIPAVLFSVVHRDPEPLGKLAPQLPTGIVAMVMRALSKRPEARYANAGAMLHTLRVVLGGGDVAEEEAAFASDDPTPARELGTPLAELETASPEMREALAEIEQYLADRVPPLMAADSVNVFLGAPRSAAAAQILAWATPLQAAQSEATLGDLLYHALHKLSAVGELNLVDKDRLLDFLREVGSELAAACPPGFDRDNFRRSLAQLGEPESEATQALELRPAARPAPAAPPATTPGLKRLSILEQRLRREALLGAGAAVARRRVVSQAIAAAAIAAANEKDLEDHLDRLKDLGVAAGAEQVIRSLGQELGDWAMPKALADETHDLGPASEVQALQRIIALPEDPAEVTRRYRHLVGVATEQFNEGNLGRAVQMFELARRLAAVRTLEPAVVDEIQGKGHEALDPARLRQYMDRPDRLQQLQEVMDFFERGLSAEQLLGQLEVEERRERRRMLLDLLVAHGDKARALASARLTGQTEASDYARRNWIYLLRHVPRPPGAPPDGEIEAVARHAVPERPGFLVKEALTYLAQAKDARMGDVLSELLALWEQELDDQDIDEEGYEAGIAALDRLAPALARQGGPRGWRALVRHGISKRADLGDTAARLAELGSQDLRAAPDVIEALVALVQGGLPRGGVLKRLVSRQHEALPQEIAALAGTRTPDVVALLEDVARRYASQPAGEAAARALEGGGAEEQALPAALAPSGELDGYSLPSLLHRLAQSGATGTLSLLPGDGGAPARIGFDGGRLTSARFAHREGRNAIYQLFERPFPGEFAFEPTTPGAQAAALGELGELVREGVRRSRQVGVTSALVPDDLPLEATGEAPGVVQDEPEHELVVALWQKACSQVTPRQMESELAADAFRILRPLAQWLEEGALRFGASPPSPAA